MLQKIAWNEAKRTLIGHWVPIITSGDGYMGCLCPHDEILMYPGTQEDIDRINQPLTSPTSGAAPLIAPKKYVPATVKQNFMAMQAGREEYDLWGDIAATLEMDKLVQVTTDVYANPNPGPAGRGAMKGQNGKFSWNFGHCSRALNNAMELRAVIEALPNLPEGVHVSVSTDSAHVKRGITEWIPGGPEMAG
jgi:hypothetical protein